MCVGREPYRNTFNPPISISQNIGCTQEMFITLHSKEVFNMVSVILANPLPPWIILIPISLSRKQNMARGVNAVAQNRCRFQTKQYTT